MNQNLSGNKGKCDSAKMMTFGRESSNLSKAKLTKIKQSTSKTTALTCSNEDGCHHKKSPLIFCDACGRSFHLYCKSISVDRYNQWRDDEIYWYCDYCVKIYKSIIKSIDESKNEDNEDQDAKLDNMQTDDGKEINQKFQETSNNNNNDNNNGNKIQI